LRQRRTATSAAERLAAVLISVLLLAAFGCAPDETGPASGTPGIATPAASAITEPTETAPARETPAYPTQVPQDKDTVITFRDINFENAVREITGKMIGSIYMSDVSGLKTFTARVRGIMNIGEIVYFTSLEELDLKGNHITDLSPLASLRQLKKLDISQNFTVLTGDREKGLDLSPLRGLTALEELNISGNLVTDLTPLSGMAALRKLEAGTSKLTDISGLASLTSLTYLDLSGSYRIDDAGNETGISDITPLSSLKALKTLYIQNNLVRSLEPLAGLKELSYVDATYNSLRDVADLSAMTGLKTLILRFNNIYNLDGLTGQPALEYLDLQDNFVSDISVILTMPLLDTVLTAGNPIADPKPLAIFEAIKNGTYVPETEEEAETSETTDTSENPETAETGEDEETTGEKPDPGDLPVPENGTENPLAVRPGHTETAAS